MTGLSVVVRETPRMRSFSGPRLDRLARVRQLGEDLLHDIAVVSAVLPFRVNNYVVDELIDWSAAPDDPIFRLTFPHRDMLPPEMFGTVSALMRNGARPAHLRAAVTAARGSLNPHPGDQLARNVPVFRGRVVHGLQHKYTETVLVFPAQGQTCHAYCGYCFRWAQFVGAGDLRQAVSDVDLAVSYVRSHTEISDVLFTGGDPMIMSADVLRRHVAPLLAIDHVRNIRFGTKALSYWPYRFTTDRDADDLLRLLAQLVDSGRHVAVMAHFSHPRELEPAPVAEAVRRIRDTGAVIRAQAPLVRHVNDNAGVWAAMWREMVRLGIVPYYMFVERDTGTRSYYQLPLSRAVEIYRQAIAQVSGLERTARGPVMSTSPGKVVLDGVANVGGDDVFVCRFLQSRDPSWAGRPFFARHDHDATWFDELEPAWDEPWFFTGHAAHG